MRASTFERGDVALNRFNLCFDLGQQSFRLRRECASTRSLAGDCGDSLSELGGLGTQPVGLLQLLVDRLVRRRLFGCLVDSAAITICSAGSFYSAAVIICNATSNFYSAAIIICRSELLQCGYHHLQRSELLHHVPQQFVP